MKPTKVVEVNPRTFSKRYGQQLSKDAAEQFRSSRRSVGGRQTRPVVQNQSTTTVSATPVTIAAIPRPQQKIRAAAYARVSTLPDSQQTSIEAQRQHFEDEIRANLDYEFAGIYLEAGVSGTKTEKRRTTVLKSSLINTGQSVIPWPSSSMQSFCVFCLLFFRKFDGVHRLLWRKRLCFHQVL